MTPTTRRSFLKGLGALAAMASASLRAVADAAQPLTTSAPTEPALGDHRIVDERLCPVYGEVGPYAKVFEKLEPTPANFRKVREYLQRDRAPAKVVSMATWKASGPRRARDESEIEFLLRTWRPAA